MTEDRLQQLQQITWFVLILFWIAVAFAVSWVVMLHTIDPPRR